MALTLILLVQDVLAIALELHNPEHHYGDITCTCRLSAAPQAYRAKQGGLAAITAGTLLQKAQSWHY